MKAHEANSKDSDHFGHRFENAKDWEPQFDDPKRDEWQKPDRVAELLEIKQGMTVADIGAGTGYFLSTFSRAVGESGTVLALDIEADMVRHMALRAKKEKLTNVTAIRTAAADPGLALPLSIESSSSIRGITSQIARSTQRNSLRAQSRRHGRDHRLHQRSSSGPPVKHRLTPAQVVAELKAGGLDAKALEEDLPLQYIVVATRSTQTALDPKSVPFLGARSFDGMLVGGQPTPDELRSAAKAGVKTVINLRTPKEPGVSEEVALAAELNLNYISIPVAGAGGLTVAAAKKLDEALAEANGPVIVHCGSGNRVGALFALRANKLQGKSAGEALAIGKASGLTSLEGAVRKLLGD